MDELDLKSWVRRVVMALCLIMPDAVSAGSLRCDHRVISIGQSVYEVRELCGEPQQIRTWQEGANAYISRFYDYRYGRYRAPRVKKGPIYYEAWTYDFGPQSFIRTLIFEDTLLIKIETGDKGISPRR